MLPIKAKRPMHEFRLWKVSYINSRGLISETHNRRDRRAPTAQFFVTRTPVALVVSVNPAVWLVNDPLIEPAVRAV